MKNILAFGWCYFFFLLCTNIWSVTNQSTCWSRHNLRVKLWHLEVFSPLKSAQLSIQYLRQSSYRPTLCFIYNQSAVPVYNPTHCEYVNNMSALKKWRAFVPSVDRTDYTEWKLCWVRDSDYSDFFHHYWNLKNLNLWSPVRSRRNGQG